MPGSAKRRTSVQKQEPRVGADSASHLHTLFQKATGRGLLRRRALQLGPLGRCGIDCGDRKPGLGGGGGEGGLEASDNDNTSFQHKNKTQPRKGELLFERSAHISQRCAPDFQGGSCSSSALSSGFLIRASSGIYSGGGGTQGTTPSDPECHCSKWAFDHEHVTLGPAAAPGSQESRDILGLTGFFRMRHHATSASAISLPGL